MRDMDDGQKKAVAGLLRTIAATLTALSSDSIAILMAADYIDPPPDLPEPSRSGHYS